MSPKPSNPHLPPCDGRNETSHDTRIIQLCSNPTRSAEVQVKRNKLLALFDDSTTVADFKLMLYGHDYGIECIPEEAFALYGKDAAGLATVLDLDDALYERFSSKDRPLATLKVGYAPAHRKRGDFHGCSYGYVLVDGRWKPRRFSMPNQKDPSLNVHWPIVGGGRINSFNPADYDMYLPGDAAGYGKTPYFRSHLLVLKHKQPESLENPSEKELVFCFHSFDCRDMVFWKTYPIQLQLKAQAQQHSQSALPYRRWDTQGSTSTDCSTASLLRRRTSSLFSNTDILPTFFRRSRL